MTRHGPVLLALSVLAIAGWTYNVNYDARAALDRLDRLRGEIAQEREHLQVLRVEWAYLNAPERLSRLVAEHREALALVALTPDALGHVAAVPYPPRETPDVVPQPPSELMVAAAPAAPLDPPVPESLAAEVGAADTGRSDSAEPAVAAADLSVSPPEAAAPGADGTAAGNLVVASAEAGPGAEQASAAAPGSPAQAGAAELRAAITAALIEAGVPVADEKVAIVPAAADAAAPVPLARPAGGARP